MVLPERIYRAARDGDRDTVIAYLNAPAEAGGTRDVNEQSATGGTILMAAVCQIDSAARLAFVWELVGRGADLCSIIDHDYRDMSWLGMWVSSVDVFELAVAGAAKGESCPELFRDFVYAVRIVQKRPQVLDAVVGRRRDGFDDGVGLIL